MITEYFPSILLKTSYLNESPKNKSDFQITNQNYAVDRQVHGQNPKSRPTIVILKIVGQLRNLLKI